MNEELKAELNQISYWQQERFPNGSSYKMQHLPKQADLSDGKKLRFAYYGGAGEWIVTDKDGETIETISTRRRSIGKGANFGPNYCTRDQAIFDLL